MIDHVALLPAYLAGATAVLVLLVELLLARPGAVLLSGVLGAAATAVAAALAARGPARGTFCGAGGCSYVLDDRAALVAALFALLALGVLGLSAGHLRAGAVPPGEYCFLLACSMTGGVALAGARDLILLIVALETLTLPLYILVGLRRRTAAGAMAPSADAAVTFFVVSVVATSVTLLGAALLYAGTGAVRFAPLAATLADGPPAPLLPLTRVGVVLVLAGLAFKVAAVPFHAWAPATYDGAPLPVAAYLSTASKVGGVVAILAVVTGAFRPALDVAGPVLAALAVLTMTVGNLVALRQRRMVRLLAWSSVAQAGYILAPFGAFAAAAGRTGDALAAAVAAAIAYTVFYVVMELGAFAAVTALRPPDADGGDLADYRAAARRSPWVGAALVLALVGLAGLPPGLAGLFAKVAVVRALLAGGAGWLAVIVALNAVIGLAYYVRVAALLYAPADPRPAALPATAPSPAEPHAVEPPSTRPAWPVAAAVGTTALLAVLVGFAPQIVLAFAGR
ncbi:NADH-quinone oxidoreductase subunit N [Rhizomonospora bruguierae]|uniref:NADH-quinone oxidoreductase subunit N n=1 Tax=Rhizomonospora bruguierae TaxID=1581705 RepID=UPI001BCE9C3A|nr:NADH-quinone oxidoreductase subunit N [Micromonospora sp. NBRC 107566]